MAVESDGVVDQFTAVGVEQRGDLTVYQSNGQDRQSHEGECQECAGTAVAEEHRIPVADIGENGTCRYCVDKDQCQAFCSPFCFLSVEDIFLTSLSALSIVFCQIIVKV